MKIYITGATGVLGKRIIKELSGLGHTVVGMARSARAKRRSGPWASAFARGPLRQGRRFKGYRGLGRSHTRRDVHTC
ncbi:MAG: NAD-dependent epimerase/dehydratase family protein [Thermodesulfobacteriota bacterium]